ncbi:flagellar hook capping FlgD N-terminal domain-containing protein [Dethiobacter alkaliphilus]|uniref:Flagellar hook capping protein n=1 Tax=Dethiobacter alkaliphilus AHT 1 TaxID=555088 RepID=C0GJH6_DETAL|nr:flagellar hook capping FlgD N-terminal domain-containing protein [Dethiobacter alkaliphilus]EEG76523.1 flagellar hook capping protein [Dethiobacter alkaliphilus AHT 1]
MTTVSAAGTTAATQQSNKATGAMQEMDKDMFLQLLVTQLRYQDPLDPQDNSEFVAQMAQFTSLEQMQNLNNTMAKLLDIQSSLHNSAPAFLGLSVTVKDDNGLPLTGIVSAVEYDNGKPRLVIDGNRYGLESVQKVTAGGE